MKKVLYGHAAYYLEDGTCTIPEDTTFTIYGSPGSLLDETVANALANGETVTKNDIEGIKESLFFINKGMDVPENQDPKLLADYPKVLKAGDVVPNYFLNTKEVPDKTPLQFDPNYEETIIVSETTHLKELLDLFKGQDIHWAACSFSKDPNENDIGYGYAYKFKKTSPLYNHYSESPKTEDEKRKLRAEKFGTVEKPTIDRTPTPRARHSLFREQEQDAGQPSKRQASSDLVGYNQLN